MPRKVLARGRRAHSGTCSRAGARRSTAGTDHRSRRTHPPDRARRSRIEVGCRAIAVAPGRAARHLRRTAGSAGISRRDAPLIGGHRMLRAVRHDAPADKGERYAAVAADAAAVLAGERSDTARMATIAALLADAFPV